MDLERPFRGSAAVRAGLVTRGRLRGPGFRQLLHGVHLRSDVAVTYLLRCEAAALTIGALEIDGDDRGDAGDRHPGALAGWSAAEMLGGDCAPRGVPVEVLVPGRSRRQREGLRVHRGAVLPAETVGGVGIPVPGSRPPRFVPGRTVTTTSALRTAFDLARREARTEAVIALDALSRIGGFTPDAVLAVADRHPGARGASRLPGLVALASPLAASPMETRVRLALHDGGLPPPVLQHPVGRHRIDLAYPRIRLGIEYDGGYHREPRQARADLARQEFLTARGWRIHRPEAVDVLRHPEYVAVHVRLLIAECCDIAGRTTIS